jgi:SulP family sulfate permease
MAFFPSPAHRKWSQVKAGLAGYVPGYLAADTVAGLTVMVVAVPQCMAYAIIAGVPPAYGLYTAIVSGMIGSLFGSSRHLITGPSNATSLMFALTLAPLAGRFNPAEILFFYTFLIGFFKFGMGFFRLGRLVHYISESVIIGFTAGAGILIAGNQLKNFLGVQIPDSSGMGFFSGLIGVVRNAGDANPYDVAIASGTVIVILVLRRWNRNIPGPLLAIVLAAMVVFVFGLNRYGVRTVGDIGRIPRSLPPFRVFTFDFAAAGALAPGALAMAVVGLMEATAISRSIAASTRQRLSSNREFVAQGLANLIGPFFSNYASSCSFTRSAVNFQAGARTRMGGVLSAVFVGVVLLGFGPLGEFVPVASLAGLLMVVAYHMISKERLRLAVRAGRESSIIMVVTMAATILLRIDVAIGLGVAASLLFFIRSAGAGKFTLLAPTDDQRFVEIPLKRVREDMIRGKPIIFNLAGAICFGAMDEFFQQIEPILEFKPRAVILRMRRVGTVDSSAVIALENIHREISARKIPMLICGVDSQLLRTLDSAGIVDTVGPGRVLTSSDVLFDSVQSALLLANSMADAPTRGDEHAG